MARDWDGVDDVLTGTITPMDTGDWTSAWWSYLDVVGNLDRFWETQTAANVERAKANVSVVATLNRLQATQPHATTTATTSSANSTLIGTMWQCWVVTYRASDSIIRMYVGTLTAPMAETTYAVQTAGVGARSIDGVNMYAGNRLDTTRGLDGKMASLVLAAREWTLAEMEYFRQLASPSNFTSTRGVWELLGTSSPEPDVSGQGVDLTVTGAIAADGPPIGRYPTYGQRLAQQAPPAAQRAASW